MKKLIVLLVMLAAMNANAQWVEGSGTISQSTVSMAAIGINIFAGMGYGQGVFISTNNGISWVQTSLNNITVNAVAVLGNNVFAGTYNSGVLISTNNGTNWTPTSLNNITIYALAVNENTIYAGTDIGSIYYSSNNGINWNIISITSQPIYSIGLSGSYIFAGTTGNGIFVSSNNGINWTQTFLTNKSVHSILVSGSNVYAGLWGSGGVYLSTNNGSSWTQTSLNNRSVWSIVASGNNIFAGMDAYPLNDTSGVYMSTNNGVTWIQKNQGFNGNMSIQSLLIANNYMLAGTFGQSIWRRPLSELVGIQNISSETPSKFSLSQNYPNPFNPTTKIKFAMPKSGNAKIVVYDVMGREVQTLVNERLQAGTYEATFDGSTLNSGVYFYKLIVNGQSETKKMLLLK